KTNHTSPDDAVNDIFFIDLNGDGRADILKPDSITSWDIMLSRPSTTSEMIVWEKRGELARNANDVIMLGDADGDGKIDLLTSADINGWNIAYGARKGIIDNVITDFTNGWGVKTTVTYDSILSDAVTMKNSDGNLIAGDDIADTLSPIGPMAVVQKVHSDSTATARVSVEYRYGGFLLHRKGLGALGFKYLTTTDNQTNVITTTTNSQTYPHIGTALNTEQKADALLISFGTNTPSQLTTSNGGIFPFIDGVEQTQYQIGTAGEHHTLATTVTDNDFDDWGNLTGSTIKIKDSAGATLHITTTSNSFGIADTYEQKNGRLLTTSVTKTLAGADSITRFSAFTYYAENESCNGKTQYQGMLKTTAVNGLTTTKCYNAFGLNSQVTKSASLNDLDTQETAITASTVYSSDGRMVSSATNNLGHTTTFKYNGLAATGEVRKMILNSAATDTNNVTVKSHFDYWGNTLAVESPLAATKSTKTAYCDSCTSGGKYYVEVKQNGAPTKRVEFDKFGREIASRVSHFSAGYTYTFKDYDAQGRLLKEYLPTASAVRATQSSGYTKYNIDTYSRVTSIELANSNGDGYAHPTTTVAGLVTTITDAKNQSRIETRNLLGQLVNVQDDLGGVLTYSYDAYGNLKKAWKASVAQTAGILQVDNTYNAYGQKTQMTDIDKGTWYYRFNGFGQAVWQQNANSDITTTQYDASGRKMRQYSHDFTQCWIYGGNSANNAIGKLVGTRYFDAQIAKNCTYADCNQG
ncbi:MAG: hypothetical protein MJK04_06400, partial [Psychrosphaera sp.]|nr:hypothetical protein [Psychrosphaera sp.]